MSVSYFELLSREEKEIIMEEIGESKSLADESIQHLKEWLLKQPHLPDTLDDRFILSYLRLCNFSLEKTKHKLDMLCSMRTAIPDFLSGRDPMDPDMLRHLDNCYYVPLPSLTPEGYRVHVFGIRDSDVSSYSYTCLAKCITLMCELDLLLDDMKTGDVIILEISKYTLHHLLWPTMVQRRQLITCLQESFPFRPKQIHLTGISQSVIKMVNIVKPIMKEKIRNRMHMHSDINDLYKYLSKDILPAELGGHNGSIFDYYDTWRKVILNHRKWIINQDGKKADESLRPGKPKTHEELFGVDGSFRQLTID